MLTAGGMALVAFVFAAVLMLAEGLEQTLVDTGSPDNAIVLRAAAETEVSSSVSREQGAIAEVQPEVTQTAGSEPIAARETLVLVTLKKKGTDKPTNVVVRGIGPHSMLLRPQVKLLAGRFPKPGFQRGHRRKEHRTENRRRIAGRNSEVCPCRLACGWGF